MEYIPLKVCPVCGEPPEFVKESLEGPNGHGYKGCYEYSYRCDCCKLLKGTEATDIYDSSENAKNRAKLCWNAEVDRVQELLDRKNPKVIAVNKV